MIYKRIAGLLVAASTCAVACSASSSDSNYGDGANQNNGAAGAGSSGSVGSSGSPNGGFGSGSVTPASPVGDAGPGGCNAVDLLFLVDSSSSMGPKQEKLAAAWPLFVDAIFSKLPKGTSLHIGLTTTSFYSGSTSESTVNCASGETDAKIKQYFVTPATSNTSENGGQGRLYAHEGKKFYEADTSADPAALKAWFSGAAVAIGQRSSSYEFPAAGAAYVADPANDGANAGFIRDKGAVLVMVFLTDEPDKSYAVTTPAALHDMVVAKKKDCGGDRCVLTAGVLTQCIPAENQFLWKFMNSFGGKAPLSADIEGPGASYSTVVGDTLAQTVRDTCDKIPSGPR